MDRLQRILSQVDHFFPVNKYTRQLLVDIGISDEKMTLFNHGTDPDYFRSLNVDDLRERLFGSRMPVIMTMARFVSWKGIDTVRFMGAYRDERRAQ